MTEAHLVKTVKRNLVEMYGGWWVKVHGSIFQAAGVPDLIGVTRGKTQRPFGIFFAFEVKLPGKESTLTRLQSFTIRKINENGGVAAMITTPNEVRRVVEGALSK